MVHHPEFSKTRQRKVKRHFDELCEDERLQDPEGFLTMLFLHRKASKWKMNMKSPIRIERRPMPSSGTYMYRLVNVNECGLEIAVFEDYQKTLLPIL
ncbi:hypothetical protein EVAR_26583_1 [Eumeta japonica]|uniref:Uncharacterized protein n=1 Tax=Eumeta variegata TaxID=151549 RepID=A0A4C1W483_EUMVA|nr:hypothetical protein EVAR_26583_1 [Eumeta japonica]